MFQTLAQALVLCLVDVLRLTSVWSNMDLLAKPIQRPSRASLAWPFQSSISIDIRDLNDNLVLAEIMLEGRGRTTSSGRMEGA